MFSRIRRTVAELRRQTSGNATLLVALGMPALIGGAGLAVDTAQWYMWKRELQFAVDQAALAGAWARTDDATKANYATRATQELQANLSVTEDIAAEPDIDLLNYAGGVENSVMVSITASRALPFSSFLTGSAATVRVYAQASFEAGATYSSCLIAVDKGDTEGAITIGGASVLTASCGLAALSTNDLSIKVNGSPEIDAGWIISKGGIDEWFKTNTNDVIQEHMSSLYDPYEDLSPPNPAESQVSRTYTCVKGTKTTRANIKNDIETTYTYYKGNSPDTNGDGAISSAELAAATWQLQENSKGKSKETSSTSQSYVIENDTVDVVTTTTTRTITKTNNSTGANATWEMKTTVTTKTQSGTTVIETPEQATAFPGTYTGGIKVGCNTVFGTGVYILDGGGLDISGQYSVTGSSVMFVLKNGAHVKINGGSNINLTAIQASDLIARGVSTEQANKLAGMLIFEDRNSGGTDKNNINGNASTVLNGTIYLPKSAIDFAGTASVTSQCLMIAAKTIKITGTANMTTFCPAGMDEDTMVANAPATVKLVA
jgi:Flp pilus assembly protein TadG